MFVLELGRITVTIFTKVYFFACRVITAGTFLQSNKFVVYFNSYNPHFQIKIGSLNSKRNQHVILAQLYAQIFNYFPSEGCRKFGSRKNLISRFVECTSISHIDDRNIKVTCLTYLAYSVVFVIHSNILFLNTQ